MRFIQKNSRQDEKGFTLIEVLVALVVLATGILAVVQLFSGATRLATASDSYLRGVHLANDKFSQIELENFETEDLTGVFEEAPDYRWEFAVTPFESPLNDPTEGIELNQVTLNVFWEENSREHTVQLASIWTKGSITRPAPDVVLLGNTSSLASGSSANQANNTSPQASPGVPGSGSGSGSGSGPGSGSGSGSDSKDPGSTPECQSLIGVVGNC